MTKTKLKTTDTRTTVVSKHNDLLSEGFLFEREAAKYLGVSRTTLAMYRVKWHQTGSGTGTGADGCGPLFFQGPGGRIAYRIEDLDVFKNRTADATPWQPATVPAAKGKK